SKHFMPDAELERIGIRIVVYPQDILAASVRAMRDALAGLAGGGDAHNRVDQAVAFDGGVEAWARRRPVADTVRQPRVELRDVVGRVYRGVFRHVAAFRRDRQFRQLPAFALGTMQR